MIGETGDTFVCLSNSALNLQAPFYTFSSLHARKHMYQHVFDTMCSPPCIDVGIPIP